MNIKLFCQEGYNRLENPVLLDGFIYATDGKMEHTKTPWKVYKQPTGDIKIYSEKGFNCPTIAIMWEKTNNIPNAEHIVKCVNSHDELVRLLKIANDCDLPANLNSLITAALKNCNAL